MTESMLHGALAERWGTLSISEQLANVGSEVDRAIRSRDNAARFEGAFARALDLFDLTAADPRWAGARRREVLRGREEFCRIFHDAEVDPGSANGLRRYFLHFAVAANRLRSLPSSDR